MLPVNNLSSHRGACGTTIFLKERLTHFARCYSQCAHHHNSTLTSCTELLLTLTERSLLFKYNVLLGSEHITLQGGDETRYVHPPHIASGTSMQPLYPLQQTTCSRPPVMHLHPHLFPSCKHDPLLGTEPVMLEGVVPQHLHALTL